LLLCAYPPVTPAQNSDNTTARLPELVETYFRAPNDDVRSTIAEDIESLEGITIDAVADAVRRVQLWQPQTPGFEHFVLDTRRGVPMDVHVHIPANYDPTQAYPLLLAFHGSTGTGDRYIHFALQLLGDCRNEFIVAAPTRLEGPFISSQPDEAFDLPDLLRELKHRYHIDTDRVYASGYSRGGHTSFLIGLLYTDVIAATVPLAGTFATQVGYGLMDVMLPNIRHLPTLVVYGELDRTERDGEEGGIAISNQYMARIARRLEIPIELIELEGVGHSGVRPPPDRFLEMLRKTRPHDIKQFEHWFRHLPQGRLNFLGQTRFLGIPWKAKQLHVRLKDGETYSEAFDRTIRLKLACIAGKIEGQSITIETRKCGEVALLLNDHLIDLDRDIIVTLNGRQIYEGSAKRSIRTLLEVAHEDWDFQRLFTTRFRITRKGRIKQTDLR
jgi:predicted esterase